MDKKKRSIVGVLDNVIAYCSKGSLSFYRINDLPKVVLCLVIMVLKTRSNWPVWWGIKTSTDLEKATKLINQLKTGLFSVIWPFQFLKPCF